MRNSLTDPQLQTKISCTHGIYSGETLDKFLLEPPSHIDWAWAPQRSRTMKGTPMKIIDGQDPYRCGFPKKIFCLPEVGYTESMRSCVIVQYIWPVIFSGLLAKLFELSTEKCSEQFLIVQEMWQLFIWKSGN